MGQARCESYGGGTICKIKSAVVERMKTTSLSVISKMYFDSLIRFVSSEDQKSYFAPISCKNAQLQACRPGEVVVGYSSIGDLEGQQNGKKVTIKKVCRSLLCLSFSTM